MRKSLLILLCLSMSYFLMAQETVKLKEIGLVSSNLDDIGLTFKTGTDKALWRINTLFMSGDKIETTNGQSVSTNSNFNLAFKVGREYRRYLTDNLELRYGADVSFSCSKRKVEDGYIEYFDIERVIEDDLYQPGVNFVFGFNYELFDDFLIGVELLPYFNYVTQVYISEPNSSNNDYEVRHEASGIRYGLSSKSILFSLAYRFR